MKTETPDRKTKSYNLPLLILAISASISLLIVSASVSIYYFKLYRTENIKDLHRNTNSNKSTANINSPESVHNEKSTINETKDEALITKEKPSTLENLFKIETIGANILYIEKIIGPAWKFDYSHDEKKERVYKIDGCEVKIGGTNEIEYLGMTLTDKCKFNLNNFYNNFKPGSTKSLNFAKFYNESPSVFHNCLVLCGNSQPPMAFLRAWASRSDRMIQVELTGWGGDSELARMIATQEGISTDGLHIIDAYDYQCEERNQKIVQERARNIEVSEIRIGFNIYEDECPIKK